jgi:hypothetical protein
MVIEDAAPERFPDYEKTHGLPKFVGRLNASPTKRTNLLTAGRNEPINFIDPKHPQLGLSSSLEWDAYLLWRLSERYEESPFPIGKLDKDRVIRLHQLDVLEVIDPIEQTQANEETIVRIRVPRRPLNEHFLDLQRRVST